MVKVIKILDTHLLGADSKMDLTSQVILLIIPDLYLRHGDREQIVMGEDTLNHVNALARHIFPAIRVDYWPSYFGKQQMGKALIIDLVRNLEQEKGLFYRDKDVIFFQRLPKDYKNRQDIPLIRDYLKRYNVILPDPTPNQQPQQSLMENLIHIIQDEFESVKLKIFYKKEVYFKQQRDPLLSLFQEHRRSFWQDFFTKISMSLLMSLFCLTTGNQYWDRLHRLDEIERLGSEITSLTPKELKTSQAFEKMEIYQKDRLPVTFDFAKTIMDHWLNRLVITAMDWHIEEGSPVALYTLTFHPDGLGENGAGDVEQFIDWLETQHPRVEIKEKDSQNGSIRLLVPTL